MLIWKMESLVKNRIVSDTSAEDIDYADKLLRNGIPKSAQYKTHKFVYDGYFQRILMDLIKY